MSDKTLQTLESEIEISKVMAMALSAENKLQARLASRWEARVYVFDGEANFQSVSQCIETLDTWRRLDATRDVKKMHIIFNGAARMMQSMALLDFIRWLRLDGFTVTFEVAGHASSQSAAIMSAASHRVMTKSSWLQIDEVVIDTAGNTTQAKHKIEWNARLEAQLRRLLSHNSKASKQKVAAATHLKTWNVDADTALALGMVDEVSAVRPEQLMMPLGYSWPDLPAHDPNSLKDQLSIAAIRKMRAEGYLLDLENWDEVCSPLRNGVVRFFDTVNTASVNRAKIALEAAMRLSRQPITLQINSNGGSVTDGLGFIDLCRQVSNSGRELNTEVLGYAASMGGIMLQCGKKRTMGRESWLLIHQVSSWFGDTTSNARLSHAYCMELQAQSFGILAERSVFTAAQIQEKCRDHDWWLSAEEAKKYGFIDEIR